MYIQFSIFSWGIVKQFCLHICIKQEITNSKLHTKFCISVIYAGLSLFVWSSKMAKTNLQLIEVFFSCIIIFSTHVYIYPGNEDDHENAKFKTLFKVGQFKNAIRFEKLNYIRRNCAWVIDGIQMSSCIATSRLIHNGVLTFKGRSGTAWRKPIGVWNGTNPPAWIGVNAFMES